MRVTLLALLVPASIGFASLAVAENVGEATRIQRYAYQTPPQAGKTPIYRLDPVVRNARLETVPSGALEVTFTDGSRLTLGSSSNVVVDNYVFGGAQGTSGQTLKMTRGLFRFVSGSMPKDQVKLQTPSVTIGIRGTVVKLKVGDDGKETVFFEHGQGYIDNRKGQNVPMGEGDMVKINPDGTIGTPEKTNWSAGDESVDFGLNPFGQQNHGPDGGTGGGDGAGSSGGGNSGNR
ncbi:MAG: FecR domain-containing protein [Alphaproteobacteria bacterium]|nr:FecR domain-containing protein [Alphaproteobacteria bacterium]